MLILGDFKPQLFPPQIRKQQHRQGDRQHIERHQNDDKIGTYPCPFDAVHSLFAQTNDHQDQRHDDRKAENAHDRKIAAGFARNGTHQTENPCQPRGGQQQHQKKQTGVLHFVANEKTVKEKGDGAEAKHEQHVIEDPRRNKLLRRVIQVIEQRLATGLLQKTFAADSDRCEKCDDPEKRVPTRFIKAPLKTQCAHKNSSDHVNEYRAQCGFLAKFQKKLFFYECRDHAL